MISSPPPPPPILHPLPGRRLEVSLYQSQGYFDCFTAQQVRRVQPAPCPPPETNNKSMLPDLISTINGQMHVDHVVSRRARRKDTLNAEDLGILFPVALGLRHVNLRKTSVSGSNWTCSCFFLCLYSVVSGDGKETCYVFMQE